MIVLFTGFLSKKKKMQIERKRFQKLLKPNHNIEGKEIPFFLFQKFFSSKKKAFIFFIVIKCRPNSLNRTLGGEERR